jgi:ribokinase
MPDVRKILVIGSSNTDLVVRTARFPRPGETVLGSSFFMAPGGKGANQAVAAARLGAKVTLIAKLGADLFGQAAMQGLTKEGINTEAVLVDTVAPSGIAVITLDDQGENHIIVAPGANMHLSAQDIMAQEILIRSHDLILVQLEIPLDTIAQIVLLAQKHQKKLVLNPAPAQDLPNSLLDGLFLITPNETEAGCLTATDPMTTGATRKMALNLLDRGVQNVIITLGEKGAFFISREQELQVSAPRVQPVDTTGAGDIFNGALAFFVAEGAPWSEAILHACRAASFSVTRLGAQSSAPTKTELLAFS